ncbi:hypothetical protein [Sorangium sp. So ce233]
MTPDLEGAMKFYGSLFEWTSIVTDPWGASFTLMMASKLPSQGG